MLVLSADSLVFQMLRLPTKRAILARGLDRFGLMESLVVVMSHRYFHANITDGGIMIAFITKTQGYVVQNVEVKINNKHTIQKHVCSGQREYCFTPLYMCPLCHVTAEKMSFFFSGSNLTTPGPHTNTSRYCNYWQFRCRNGQCIDGSYLCDGGYDCYDGSDEDWLICPS